jgi:hypothetical protein
VEARKKGPVVDGVRKTDAEKIGRTVKITNTQNKQKKQYREILKQIQGNLAKQKINKGNQI